jgi:hypothetical protein
MATSIRIHPTAAESEIAIDVMNLVRIARKAHPDKAIDFTLKPERRSTDQNALMWVVFTHLAKCFTEWQPEHRYVKEDAHDYMLADPEAPIPYIEKRVGKRDISRKKTTSELSKAEAVVFIEWMLGWCASRGKPMPLEPKYAEWLEANR